MTQAVLLVLPVVTAIIINSACDRGATARQYVCDTFSPDCELEKDNLLFLPLDIDSAIVDVAGLPVQTYGYQWYLFNKKSNRTMAIGVKDGPTYVPHPQMLLNHLNSRSKSINDFIQIDTLNISHVVHGVTKAILILTGKNEIRPERDGYGNYVVAFTKAKQPPQ